MEDVGDFIGELLGYLEFVLVVHRSTVNYQYKISNKNNVWGWDRVD